MLYPSRDINIGVPAWIGNSLYIFPDAPITGFERGIMSSLVGALMTSMLMECTRSVSLMRATNQGIVSKSLAVKSLSPLALIPFNVSSISARNRSWY